MAAEEVEADSTAVEADLVAAVSMAVASEAAILAVVEATLAASPPARALAILALPDADLQDAVGTVNGVVADTVRVTAATAAITTVGSTCWV